MRWVSWLALIVGMLAAPEASLAVEASGRPNIVLIIADDMAWDDCGAYGHPKIRTPNIDRLARDGMRFDRAFLTTSSCSPSRCSILTGRYPHNTGAEELHQPLPADQVTFSEKLKAGGYFTASAGKWHLGNAVKDRFDVVRGGNSSRGAGVDPGASESGCGQWVAVLRDRPRDRPFFLWLASFDPHRGYRSGTIDEPHQPGDAVVPPYLPDTPEVRKDLALYYDEIARLDHYVGEVLAELDRQGVADETLVLFISDNGRPFPRCKTTIYDSGVRTPMFARWPGHIKPGSRCESLVSTVDIAPTVLTLAGLKPGPTIQGKDLSKLFDDPSAKVHEFVFSERNWHDFGARARSVRSERFRYIKNDDHERPLIPPADAVRSPTYRAMRRLRDAGKLTTAQRACFIHPRPVEELYDLEADPDELQNLADDPKHADVLARMRQALADWTRQTNDVNPGKLTPDRFDPETGEPLSKRAAPRRGQR